MSYHPQQEGPKIIINFYDNNQQINLPSTFFELYNLIPSIISVEHSYFINNFTLTYTFQYDKYEITNENTSLKNECQLKQQIININNKIANFCEKNRISRWLWYSFVPHY